jgi:hypothetical protein
VDYQVNNTGLDNLVNYKKIHIFIKKEIMKLFKVTIDSNPGAWKSGSDPSVLVPAKNKEDAIQKVKDGWSDKYEYKEEGIIVTYMKMVKEFPIRETCRLYAEEIRFEGYDIHVKSERAAKLDRIAKHIKRNEI